MSLPLADSFQHLHHVGAAEVETRFNRRLKRENPSMIVSTRSFGPVAS
jgi:hypothetical protein